MYGTEEMRRVRHAFQELTASDPAAKANMLRHLAAINIMVTGRRGRDRREGEPQISSSFVLTSDYTPLWGEITRRSGLDAVVFTFDMDDAAGPLVALNVIRKEVADMVIYDNCRLWCPAGDGRALIVPIGAEYVGHFAFEAGHPLRHVAGSLPRDVDSGFRRAETRMQRLLSSEQLQNVHREGYVHMMQNHGEEFAADVRRAAT